jgi:hypothetical protein
MARSWFLALPFALALASPAAALSCDGHPGGAGIKFSFGIHVGEPYTEDEIAVFDQMELRRRGVDATRAERWSGCIRAWVRQADGTEKQQFFDPHTFERLDPAR